MRQTTKIIIIQLVPFHLLEIIMYKRKFSDEFLKSLSSNKIKPNLDFLLKLYLRLLFKFLIHDNIIN